MKPFKSPNPRQIHKKLPVCKLACNWDRSMSSNCNDSESLLSVEFELWPGSVWVQWFLRDQSSLCIDSESLPWVGFELWLGSVWVQWFELWEIGIISLHRFREPAKSKIWTHGCKCSCPGYMRVNQHCYLCMDRKSDWLAFNLNFPAVLPGAFGVQRVVCIGYAPRLWRFQTLHYCKAHTKLFLIWYRWFVLFKGLVEK